MNQACVSNRKTSASHVEILSRGSNRHIQNIKPEMHLVHIKRAPAYIQGLIIEKHAKPEPLCQTIFFFPTSDVLTRYPFVLNRKQNPTNAFYRANDFHLLIIC